MKRLSAIAFLLFFAAVANAATYTVTTAADSGPGSLRQAILDANASATASVIEFNIGGGGAHAITLASALPDVTVQITIDGTTQPGYAGTPLITFLDPSTSSFVGFNLNEPNSIVRGLRFDGLGRIELRSADGSTIEDNVGLNRWAGVRLFDTSNAVVQRNTCTNCLRLIEGDSDSHDNLFDDNSTTGFGGLADFGMIVDGNNNTISNNVVSGGGDAVTFAIGGTSNVITGNVSAGTASGMGIAGTGHTITGNEITSNVTISGSGHVFGGDTPAERNYVHGRIGIPPALRIHPSGDIHVLGNWFGLTPAGAPSANGASLGVEAGGGTVYIGGSAAGEGNVFAASQAGIQVGAANVEIVGNRIGVLPNGGDGGHSNSGIILNTGATGVIGPDNEIAHNSWGIYMSGSSSDVTITQNSIYDNSTFSIENNSVTANDSGDGDGGMNGGQNYPTLSSAVTTGANTRIIGTLNSTPSTPFVIELFRNPACHATGQGEGLDYVTSINVNTDAAGNASFDVTVPGFVAGDVITSTATGSTGTSEFSFCVTATGNTAPTITTFTPNSGAPGTTITITGTNFTGATNVSFNGTSAQFTVVSANQINAVVPAGATSGPITVTTGNGTATSASNFTVTVAPPSIGSIVPDEGRAEGGTSVSIRGTGFASGATVTFGGVSATSVQFVNSERLEVVTPAHAAGPVNVTVTNPDSQSDTATNGFTYVTCFAPQITSDTNDAGVMRGASATLTITADGDAPLAYQWYRDVNGTFQPIDGTTGPSLEVSPDNTTSYRIDVSNGCGSTSATIRVIVCGAAVTTADPVRIKPGETTTVGVLADSPSIIAVQWFELTNGTLVLIPGVTTQTFTTPVLQKSIVYVARVTTPCGVVESSPIVVEVGGGKRRAVRH